MKSRYQEHEPWMRRALDLARRGEGLTRPNPPVGAVIVNSGRLVAEGYHRTAGGPHAEMVALQRAGRRARGSTLYVTLEPCCTWGRTPPCTDAILAHGVREVVVSVRDPNPVHRGRGLRVLQRHGVEVVSGVCAKEGAELVAPFAAWVTTGRPYVSLKLAVSADGKTADLHGASRWITGPKARALVHDLRRRADGIMVGAGTVRRDDPVLLPRPARGRKPWRIVVTRDGNVPSHAKLLNDEGSAQTLVAVSKSCPRRAIRRLQKKGVDVLKLASSGDGVSLVRLLEHLGRRGLLHVLCEGGSEVAASLIRARLVDEFIFCVAPCVIGGKQAVGSVGGRGWKLGAQPRLRFVSVGRAGEDLVIRAKPR
ncbi:MAG: bifunctional diaminohydroxyphosphoribosylaminopyrimidine deaminase/5-amino-6-(5-phosphoribosylamino)uracil reductase RibD [Verrucomicrobiota bacterium]